jgi:hypothetical protein
VVLVGASTTVGVSEGSEGVDVLTPESGVETLVVTEVSSVLVGTADVLASVVGSTLVVGVEGEDAGARIYFCL